MFKTLKVDINGLAPCIMHNGQTANPLCEYTKRMKELTGKHKKTDSDIEALSRIEWEAGLYLDDELRPAWPGENVEAMLFAASKNDRAGKKCRAGLFSNGVWRLKYDGPSDLDALYADKRFVDARAVVIQRQRIIRTRPIFRKWSLAFEIEYNAEVLNASEVERFVVTAGSLIGLSDFRPKFGRFEVVNIKAK